MVKESSVRSPNVVQMRARRARSPRKPAPSGGRIWIAAGASAVAVALAAGLGLAKVWIDSAPAKPSDGTPASKALLIANPTAADAPAGFADGTEAVLYSPNSNWIWLLQKEEARESLLNAMRSKDRGDLLALEDRGDAFREAAGTLVKIEESFRGGYWTRVRLGNHRQSRGWIAAEFLRHRESDSPKPRDPTSRLLPNDLVELVGTPGNKVYLAVDEKSLERRLSDARVGPGSEFFGVPIAAKARVLESKRDRVHVRLDVAYGREGWILTSEVRVLPTQGEMLRDVVDGHDQATRRMAYLALQTKESELPSLVASGVVDEKTARERNHAEIAARFGIDPASLMRIADEGERSRWPGAPAP